MNRADAPFPFPRDIRRILNRHVVGQHRAKKTLSVALFTHYQLIEYNQGSHQNANDFGNDVLDTPKRNLVLDKSNIIMFGKTGCGKTLIAKTLAECLNVPTAICDCTKLTKAGFKGKDVETVVATLLANAKNDVERCETGIIFLDEIDKIRDDPAGEGQSGQGVGGRGVQEAMLKMVEGDRIEVPKGNENSVQVNTTNILFIGMGAFNDLDKIVKTRVGFESDANQERLEPADAYDYLALVETSDLVEFGMIPEFIGRFPTLVAFHSLTEEMMVKILTKPDNALVRQYRTLFDTFGVKLDFTDGALKAIAKKAFSKKTGARGLRAIMDEILLDARFHCPGSKIEAVTVTEDSVLGIDKVTYHYRQDTTEQEKTETEEDTDAYD